MKGPLAKGRLVKSREEIIRRILIGIGMLTGVLLVASQFGCDGPQTTVSYAGFSHSGRWPYPSAGPAIVETTRTHGWIQPVNLEKPNPRTRVQKGEFPNKT